jgi:hypothetical protein
MFGKKSKTQKPKPKEIRRSAYEAARELKQQEPKVNAITNWLERRHRQNGFGEDFEYTLRPRGVR